MLGNQTFTVADPGEMDGDEFEVAQRSCEQAAAVARVLASCIEGAAVMARNAELSRQIVLSGKPDPVAWEATAQCRMLTAGGVLAEEAERRLERVAAAAGFNPRA